MDPDLERRLEQAKELLPDLYETCQVAMAKYRDYPPELMAEHDDRAAANCIYRHMIMEAGRRFDGRAGCKFLDVKGLMVLNWRDEIVWRWKKVDRRGRHKNYQTKQQRVFDDRERLPGIPEPAIRLTCGYQPDATGLAIERVVIARPMGRSVQWAAQINMIEDAPVWVDITQPRFGGTERFEKKSGDKKK